MKRVIIIWLSLASLSFSSTQIGIYLDTHVEFNLFQVLYPPSVYPSYYFPTYASSQNPQGIYLVVSYQRIGGKHSISNMFLHTRGSGNFSSSLLLNQLYFAPDGEPLPPPGQNPPGGNWREYTTNYQEIEEFPVSGKSKAFSRPQDFIFKTEPDDEAGNYQITLYYRLFGL